MTTIKYTTDLNLLNNEWDICKLANYEDICKEISCYEYAEDDKPVKLYFDIDYSCDDIIISFNSVIENIPKILDIVKSVISNYLNFTNVKPQFAVKSAHLLSPNGSWKISLHVIVINFIALKSNQKEMIHLFNNLINETEIKNYWQSKIFFDTSVYSKNRKIRSLYASKPNQNRPFILEEGSFLDTIISHYDDAILCPFEASIKIVDNSIGIDTTSCCEKYILTRQFIDRELFINKSGHHDWAILGAHFKTIFPEEQALEFFRDCSQTNNKQKEYEPHFHKYLTTLDNIPKSWNTIRKWAKIENIEVYNEIVDNYKKQEIKMKFEKETAKQLEKKLAKNEKETVKQLEKNEKELTKETEKNEKETAKQLEKNEKETAKQLEKNEKETAKQLEKNEKELTKQLEKNEKELTKQLEKNEKETAKQLEKNEKIEVAIKNGAIILLNDDEASDELLKQLDNRLIYIKGQYFFKKAHIWECDFNLIDSSILVLITKSNICKLSRHGDLISYSQNVVDAQHIKTLLFSKVKMVCDNKIYDKFHSTTKNRLCFLDGVLDFKTKQFYKWNEYQFEYYSTVQIKRNFADYFANPDREVMKTIVKDVVKIIFGNNEKGMHFLARAIAGNCEDKNWGSYLGKRDCGKGVLFDILKSSFEDYVAPFTLANIMYQRNSKIDNSEIGKKLYWLLDYQFIRLAISQEVPSDDKNMKINGEMLKKIAGGGDELTARRNFDRVDTNFLIDTTELLMGNDEIIVDIPDCDEHRVSFHSVITFKTQKELDDMKANGASDLLLDCYRVKDILIKDKCKSTAWANAFTMLIFEAWQDRPVETHVEQNEEKISCLRERLLNKYTITKNKDDFILVIDVINEFNTDNKKKINTELLSFSVIKKQHKIKGKFKDLWCYYGIKLTEKEVVTDNEEE